MSLSLCLYVKRDKSLFNDPVTSVQSACGQAGGRAVLAGSGATRSGNGGECRRFEQNNWALMIPEHGRNTVTPTRCGEDEQHVQRNQQQIYPLLVSN